MNDFDDQHGPQRPVGAREPAFNVPRSVLALILVLVGIQAGRALLSPTNDEWVLLAFAFIPARYDLPQALAGIAIPGFNLPGARVWSFVSHMFLHGDWLHLGINSLWMLAFGSVVARRLGAARFLLLSALAAAGGAAANLALHWGEFSLLIGASGAVSGQMAGAVRLMFAGGGSIGTLNQQPYERVRALGLAEMFRNRGALVFLAVWFVITIFAGAVSLGPPGEEARIAWEAHLGGFALGLALFGFLDPRRRRPV